MKLGELEKKVMERIWNNFSDTAFTVRAIVEELKKDNDTYAYNTILTVITHLYTKKLLNRKKSGKTFTYTVRFSKDQFIERASKMIFDEMQKEYGVLAIAHFAQMVNDVDPKLLKMAEEEIKKLPR